MVIGFDGSRVSAGQRTGTENYSYQLLKALAKVDRKNKYIVYLRPNSVILSSSLKNEGYNFGNIFFANAQNDKWVAQSDKGVTRNDKEGWPENFQFKKISWLRLWTQGGLALQTFRDNLDVLFVPAHTLPVIRKPGLKTVVTVHDLGSEYLPSMHQFKQRFYLGFMQKVQLQTAAKVIAVSKATKEDLVKRIGLNPKKTEVVYEGYDRELFKPVKGETLVNSLNHYNLQPKTYYLFVGTVQPRKNLERLIKAYVQLSVLGGQLSDNSLPVVGSSVTGKLKTGKPESENRKQKTDNRISKLVIVGSKGWMSDEIYELPKQLGIEDKVKFLGYVPDADLPALYCGAIALVFPSLFEGFGLPILEAQACGCPVVTSNISSMPEVGGKGAIYVNPYEIGGIVEGMKRVKSQESRVKIIKAGYENVKRFSWEKCAEETLGILLSS